MPDDSFWPDSSLFHIELPDSVAKDYDEFGFHMLDPHFCAYTFNELKQGRFIYA